MTSKPLQPISHIQSSVLLFIFFIGFSIIASMWTNIGTLLLKRYLPDPSKTSIFKVIITATIITILFSITLSYLGFSFSSFD